MTVASKQVAAGAVLLLAFAPALRAQSTSASIAGRIVDPSAARVADAKVAAIDARTNVRYETLSNASGEYHLAYLPPGRYRLEVEKSGFKKLVKPDVEVHVQDGLEIDFEMAVGPVTDVVTVEGGAPLVDTESATVSTVVDRALVENLPLNGRSVQTLIALAPGVILTPTIFNDQGQFSVNGQRADANYFTVDGVSANFGVTGYFPLMQTAGGALPALSASGGTNSLVSVDAMQEFRIQTSSFAPEFGRTPGGQVSIATRSGTNAFHGTVFEYFRDSALDARDWFVNANRLAKPQARQNDFGLVLGGPLVKDRTFFFVSYEGLRLRQPSNQVTVVPDASRAQAPATMRPYLEAYPIANGASVGPGLARFSASYTNPSRLDAYSLRVDHALSPKANVFFRYNHSPSRLEERGPTVSVGTVLSMTNTVSSSLHTVTAGLTQLLRTGVSHELRANYSNHRVRSVFALDGFGGAVPPADSALFPSGHTSDDSLFQFYVGGTGLYRHGFAGTDEQRQINLVDTLSVTTGRHQLKFGLDYRWLAPFSTPYAYSQFAQFSGVTAVPGGALSGRAVFAQATAYQSNALLSHNVSFYGQDAWSVSPRLTVTYGLRWDINPALRGKNAANDPFTVDGLDDPATMTLAPRGTSLYDTTYGNVAPRLGLAYRLGDAARWGAVLRAGVGTFYDLGQGALGGVSSYFPYSASRAFSPAPFPLSAENASPPAFSVTPPVDTILVADRHLKLPRSYQWNVAWEQSLGAAQILSLTYVGAIGRDLLRTSVLFNPNGSFQFVSVTDNSATADYHAIQVKLQRRLTRGLQGLASYVYSHSIDSASSDANRYLSTPDSVANARGDRADSDFDIRHALTAGFTFDLPSPGRRGLEAILGGWSLSGFAYARSAPPVNITGGVSFASGTALRYRPNVNARVPLELEGEQYPGGKILNKAAFSAAPAGQQGDLGRNALRGFGAWQIDLALQRRFRVTERVGLLVRGEVFHLFNHPNFGSPNGDLSSPLFGRSTQTLASSLGTGGANGGLNPLYQVGGPRSIQLVLKLEF
jgi:hypothetical protein